MSKKRYSKMMNHHGTSRTYCTGIYDNQNNRELQNSNQVIIELNTLHEESQALKKEISRDCRIRELEKENEELKESVISIAKEYSEQEILIDSLQDENEQLKQKIKSINEILNEDIGYIESLKKIEEVLKCGE